MITLTQEQKDTVNEIIDTKGWRQLLIDGMPGHVVDHLNAKTELVNQRTIMTGLKLMDLLGVTHYENVMNKLDFIASSRVIVRDFLARIRADSADVGSPTTLEMIDAVAALPEPYGFTPDEVVALKGLSLQYVSLMEANNLPHATEEILRSLE